MPSPSERPRVVITGAGSGLGRALALAYAARGAAIAVTDRDADSAEATLAAVKVAGGEGFSATVDVAQAADFVVLADMVHSRWQGLDILINNAGVATAGTVQQATLKQWHWVLDINLLGCVRGIQALAPMMTAAGGGHIVNIASFAGIANPPAMASYNAAKAAVISLSETLRFEMAPHGVGVTVACPSFFQTRLIETSAAQAQVDDTAATDAAPQMQAIVSRLMDKASVSAETVATDILRAVDRGRFLVISHPDARRLQWLKRFSPALYYRAARKSTEGFLRVRP